MTAELYTMVMTSGTVLPTGSHAFSMCVLCGISGTEIFPLRCLSDGTLAISG